jgi:hypothetical protein
MSNNGQLQDMPGIGKAEMLRLLEGLVLLTILPANSATGSATYLIITRVEESTLLIISHLQFVTPCSRTTGKRARITDSRKHCRKQNSNYGIVHRLD